MPAHPTESAVLAKAATRASAVLGLDKGCLLKVLGCSDREDIEAEMNHRTCCLQRGLKLIRIYRALFILSGGDEMAMKTWMRNENRSINAVPAEIIQCSGGLESVLFYLERLETIGDGG